MGGEKSEKIVLCKLISMLFPVEQKKQDENMMFSWALLKFWVPNITLDVLNSPKTIRFSKAMLISRGKLLVFSQSFYVWRPIKHVFLCLKNLKFLPKLGLILVNFRLFFQILDLIFSGRFSMFSRAYRQINSALFKWLSSDTFWSFFTLFLVHAVQGAPKLFLSTYECV